MLGKQNLNNTVNAFENNEQSIVVPYKERALRRFCARFFDLHIFTIIVLAIFFIFIQGFVEKNPTLLKEFINYSTPSLLFILLSIETISLIKYETTLGKSLFGIRVIDPDGIPLDFQVAYKRAISASALGAGFYIPIVYIFTLLFSYIKVIKTGSTSWDKPTNSIVVYEELSTFKAIMSTILLAFVFVIKLILVLNFYNYILFFIKK